MTSNAVSPRIRPAPLAELRGASLLTTADWSLARLEALLALAARLESLDLAGRRLDFLPGQLAYALFFDNSTRTRSAWAGAAARLGMHPVIVDGTSSQVAHGETARETGAMLGMNAHALGVRHDLLPGEGQRFMADMQRGIDEYLAASGARRPVPVVNLQSDVDHPTQALADLLWLRERFGGSLEGRRIAVTWAFTSAYAKPLSVPQGLILLLTRFGAVVTLAHPEGYTLMPDVVESARRQAAAGGGSFRITHSMDEAFAGADAVYPKSWGAWDPMWERLEAHRRDDRALKADVEARALALNARHRDWICDQRRMALTRDALYLHCLPASIGEEVAPAVMDRFSHSVARQAAKKLYVIMAVLAAALAPDLDSRMEASR
jgi:knotted carbamoyltransferase YgeW